ncbi:glycerate kinase [soil metagenome]
MIHDGGSAGSAHLLVAPDSFKGTFGAPEVSAAVARGVRRAGLEAEELPIADGGEGTLEALVAALDGELHTTTVADPFGRPVEGRFALLPDGRGLVEMAEASGLARLTEGERDAWRASTRGTGELIVAAVRAGARSVILGVGGSATTDGGAGCLEALDQAGVDPAIEVVCDVNTPWEDAARVFGPQKGADPSTVKRLEERLEKLAEQAPRDPRGVPMTGCAGGLSGALFTHRGASLEPGAAYLLDALGFDERAAAARLVITGEGRLDAQTLSGKAVGEVTARAQRLGTPCHATVGEDALGGPEARRLGLAGVHVASTMAELEDVGRRIAEGL